MKKLLILSLFFTLNVKGQESFHLTLDKTIAYPKDTVWLRGFFFNENRPQNISNGLYVNLYNDSNRLIAKRRFFINRAVTLGQLIAPDRPGLYWLQAYTLNADTQYISLTIRDTSARVVIRRPVDYYKSFDAKTVNGMKFISHYSPQTGLMCSGEVVDRTTAMLGKSVDLYITYYGDTLWKATVTSVKFGFLFKFPADSVSRSVHGSVNGYVTCRYYLRDTIAYAKAISTSDGIVYKFNPQQYYVQDNLLADLHVFIPQKLQPSIKLVKDRDVYMLQVPDSESWNYSFAVVKTDKIPCAGDISTCLNYVTKQASDSDYMNYLEFEALKDRKKEKPLKNTDIVMIFTQDSLSNFTKMLKTDSAGRVGFWISPFFGQANIKFMRNGSANGVKLSPLEKSVTFTPPDSTTFTMDTLTIASDTLEIPEFDNTYLKPAIVTPRWGDRDMAVDRRFTTGFFSNPAMYHWNIMKVDLTYSHDLWGFLAQNYGLDNYSGMMGDTPKYHGHYVLFYLDEQLTNYRNLPTDLHEIAYIKILNDFVPDGPMERMISDIPGDSEVRVPGGMSPPPGMPKKLELHIPGEGNKPVAMVCLYRRQTNADFRMNPAELNSITIKGYDKPIMWTKKDRTTLLWAPYVTDSLYKFILPTGNTESRKLVAEGVNKYGQVFHFEMELDRPAPANTYLPTQK